MFPHDILGKDNLSLCIVTFTILISQKKDKNVTPSHLQSVNLLEYLNDGVPCWPLHVCGFICVFMCVFVQEHTQGEQDRHAAREVHCKLATSDLESRIFLAVDQRHVVFIDST